MKSAILRALTYNPSRGRLENFLARCAASAPPQALVLDAGAGEGFYKRLFAHTRYQATDFCKVEKAYGQVDFISNLQNIPVRGDTYDLVVCTQVFEHLPEPQQAIAEMYRVLKPGGRLWFSTPLFFPEHEAPYDYFRYTRYGLAHLLEKAGFCVEELDWLEGYFATLGYQCRLAFRSLPLAPAAYGRNIFGLLAFPAGVLLKPVFFGLSLFFNALEGSARYTQQGMCKNYCGVAVKPMRPTPRG